MQILKQSWWETILVYPVVFFYNGVAGQDPLENHVSLPHSIPMGSVAEVVPSGYSDGLLFGMVVVGLSE
eukprot:8418067-Ditylum_brightwellii.AAC.1